MRELFSDLYRFSDWPNRQVPRVSAGVYAIWRGESLVYCGMSGRNLKAGVSDGIKTKGLWTRLNSHASGRLSGDQFCVYVANRLVIPTLRSEQLSQFSDASISLDVLTREFIHRYLSYQYVILPDAESSYELENACRVGSVFGNRPFLNPSR
jgi:hypothetical protein